MDKNEFFQIVENGNINEEKVMIAELTYSKIPDTVKRIVSLMDKQSVFVDELGRIITISEMKNADEEYDNDFTVKGIIPLIDCYDNDFVVYDYANAKWIIYNIVDGVSIKEGNELHDMF